MMNDTIATIQKRRSIRVYDERQIEDLGYSKQSNMNPLKRNGNPVIFVK